VLQSAARSREAALTMSFQEGDPVLLVDRSGRRRLIRLRSGARFHSNKGTVEHADILGAEHGALIRTSTGAPFTIWRPRLADYVVEMTRHSGVIYPKDAGVILLWGDIGPGMTVLEAGLGSGALSLYLLRAVGQTGKVVSYETRADFIPLAKKNIEGFQGPAANHLIRERDVTEPIVDGPLDRVVLDVPEPWRAVPSALDALVPGGMFLSYNPSIVQVQQTVETLGACGWFEAPEVLETLYRPWKVEGQAVRPEQTMVGHTGFIVIARRLARPWARAQRFEPLPEQSRNP
jgi:tRNA (adenine57-N1/adenine58-N1)-methyltransferase catalytic subunit